MTTSDLHIADKMTRYLEHGSIQYLAEDGETYVSRGTGNYTV